MTELADRDELEGLVKALHRLLSWSVSASTMDAAMRASGFPLEGDQPAFMLLHHVAHLGPSRPSDVADAMKTGRSNVSKIARRLEDAGLIGRSPDPRDDRQVRLRLTEPGQRIGERVVALSVRHFSVALADWPAGDVRELRRLMIILSHSLRSAPPTHWGADPDAP